MWVAAAIIPAGVLAAASMRIADQWEKAVMLRLGRFPGLRGPGVFVPLIDTVAYWIDLRTFTTSFKAEKTPTPDTVPVDVEAVLFWRVRGPEKAALEVEDLPAQSDRLPPPGDEHALRRSSSFRHRCSTR
ncbi:MAG: hypothetical protein LLF90_08385 [Methanomicrobiaceae archaeon]|uniref:SPFH domain-containing protein n=1 Tax=Methanoculleus sp. TaxID=90427 RepID=UPI00320F4072|nr:hypothetical protein [Methanomicrobiaceae archaeon]